MQSQTQISQKQVIVAEPSDETLAARVAGRDRRAFTALYDRHARAVFIFAAHLLGNADAEEVVQEVFLRLWNKASQFYPAQGNFRAWFMAIARNYVMDELRRRGQRQRIVVAEEVSDLLADAQDPEVKVPDQAWENERARAVRDALKTLPDEQRRAIVLAYFGGLTQSQIAEGLELPLGTAKKRIRLGLQKLRVALAEKKLLEDA